MSGRHEGPVRGSAIVLAMSVSVAGCAGVGEERSGGGGPQSPSSPAATRSIGVMEWIAVFRTGEDPNELEQDTRNLLEQVDGNAIVAAVGCHRGLAEALGVEQGTYFSGVLASDREELDRMVSKARESPRFRDEPLVKGEFELLCGV